MESKIALLEKDLKEIDHELLMNYDATIAAPNFFDTYQGKKKDLEILMEQWTEITIELENLVG